MVDDGIVTIHNLLKSTLVSSGYNKKYGLFNDGRFQLINIKNIIGGTSVFQNVS